MGNFNVNPNIPCLNETKYKRQMEIIEYLQSTFFFDVFDMVYNIKDNNSHNTWFNDTKQLQSRIDFIWISYNSIQRLLFCKQSFYKLYISNHHLLLAYLDKPLLL